MAINRKYGWGRNRLPSRRFPQLKLTNYPPLAASYSLIPTGFLPPIWDQATTSGCTGHGSTRGIAYARAKQKLPYVDLSRIFTYWNARVAEGDPTQDDGASVGDVIAASLKFGDCPYAEYPTTDAMVVTPPTQQAFKDAIQHKALTVSAVSGSDQAGLAYHFKHCISVLLSPVVLGFTVYESFESDEVAKTGIVPMPGPNEQVVGGHCVVATAYDDTSQMITCDNSWNTDWGIGGRFKIPYAYLFDPNMADDFHTILTEAA